MKSTSWPLNYPKSDEWPPRKRFPVVNSYANYPGMEIINNALKYSEAESTTDARFLFLSQAIETEFEQNLELELRKLWKPILEEFGADEDSVSKLINFSVGHLKMTLEMALLGSPSVREQGKRALGEQLARARLLANDDLHWAHSSTVGN